MDFKHVENLLRRYKGQLVDIKTLSGGVYEGKVAEITNDYVALILHGEEGEPDQVFVLLHGIESILPRDAS
ncbi:MAG TPA: hypothetical protein VGB17_13830 [Pyrinomonadaceae bacterium]|jgi:16S rRNA U1498 N3-methylase RsmE